MFQFSSVYVHSLCTVRVHVCVHSTYYVHNYSSESYTRKVHWAHNKQGRTVDRSRRHVPPPPKP